MIDAIKQNLTGAMSLNQKLNVTREYLQILTLKILSDKDFFDQIAFLGGTSLRILYDIKRFSEDLDFSVHKRQGYDFNKIHDELLKAFHLYGLSFEGKPKTQGNVHSMMMKFSGLLKELGLSQLSDQKFSIKLEVDTNPPAGAGTVNTIVNKMVMFNVVHYDLPSLYAGKLHACFYRKFTKGRDFYDFIWYLGKRLTPNFLLLNNAIAQTRGKNPRINDQNFKPFLLREIRQVDFKQAKKDVERFLEDKNELNMFDQKIIQDTIESVY